VKRNYNYVDLLYSSLVADGTTLPPVLFTTDPNVPEDIEGDEDARVIYMPDITKPCTKTTMAYLDTVRDYFNHDDRIILDRGKEFNNQKVKEEFGHMGVVPHYLPAGGGAFFNPNDNSFFSQVEGYYKRMPKLNHAHALRTIIGAYKKPTDEQVRAYFEHCLIHSQLPSKHEVDLLITQHWKYDEKRAATYTEYRREYQHFVNNDRRLSGDVRRIQDPLFLEGDLDGVHWTKY
jgi:hypothetical protein